MKGGFYYPHKWVKRKKNIFFFMSWVLKSLSPEVMSSGMFGLGSEPTSASHQEAARHLYGPIICGHHPPQSHIYTSVYVRLWSGECHSRRWLAHTGDCLLTGLHTRVQILVWTCPSSSLEFHSSPHPKQKSLDFLYTLTISLKYKN